jgi:hypothetical protein
MTGYTKLFSSIVHSTIWREDNETRLVWITMLAIADKNGEVEASIPGLADLSRVTVDECIESLKKLSEPDPYSRSKEFNGRRVEEIDGGWVLLNHAKYRQKMSEEDRREKNKLRQRRYRERNTCSTSVTKCHDVTPHAEADTDPKADSKEKAERKKIQYSPEFEKFWSGYPKKNNKKAAYSQWKKVKPDVAEVCVKLFEQIQAKKNCKSAGQFVAEL